MELVFVALVSFALDLLLGDPDWMPHPVVFMGRAIAAGERGLRRVVPPTPRGELLAGGLLALGLPLAVLVLSAAALWLASLVHPALRLALECLWGWQCLALRGLRDESMNVRRALLSGTLEDARAAVHRIVGRDVERLDARGVTKAAVETVAENFSDGVAAPLLYLVVGGAPLALWYKAVNTQDSMLGYKNARYLYFGRVAARLDDVANWVPSRVSALLIVMATALAGADAGASRDSSGAPGSRGAARVWGRLACARCSWRVWRRDRRNHASPNSAQTESAMAGALGVELAGPAYYFGERYGKPTIGDGLRPIEPDDICRANRVMCAAALLGLAVFVLARVGAVLVAGACGEGGVLG